MSIHYTKKHSIQFIVDDEDDARVRMFTWNLHHTGYVRCSKLGHVTLHNFLMGYAADGLQWDHINRTPTDCRKENLRQVTGQKNCRNRKLRKDNHTGHSGINFRRNQYHARIVTDDGVRKALGRFDTYEEALRVRLNAEVEYWGEAVV